MNKFRENERERKRLLWGKFHLKKLCVARKQWKRNTLIFLCLIILLHIAIPNSIKCLKKGTSTCFPFAAKFSLNFQRRRAKLNINIENFIHSYGNTVELRRTCTHTHTHVWQRRAHVNDWHFGHTLLSQTKTTVEGMRTSNASLRPRQTKFELNNFERTAK